MKYNGVIHEDHNSLFAAIASNWVSPNGLGSHAGITDRITKSAAEALTYEWLGNNPDYKAHLIDWKTTEDKLISGLVVAFRELINNHLNLNQGSL